MTRAKFIASLFAIPFIGKLFGKKPKQYQSFGSALNNEGRTYTVDMSKPRRHHNSMIDDRPYVYGDPITGDLYVEQPDRAGVKIIPGPGSIKAIWRRK